MKAPWKSMVLATLAALCLAAVAEAQPGGRRGPGGMRGPGAGLLGLAQNDAVQKEIEALPDQVDQIKKLSEELRGPRGGERPERPDFANMSEEDRQKFFNEMRQRREKQAKEANAKLGKILLKPQIERLGEIRVQTMGLRALSDPEIAGKLKISDAQKEKIQEAMRANMEAMRARFRDRPQGGDREAMRAEFEKLRKEADGKVLAVLDSKQKADFEKMKGKPFEMPRPDFRRRPGGDRQAPAGGRQGRNRAGGQRGPGRGPAPE